MCPIHFLIKQNTFYSSLNDTSFQCLYFLLTLERRLSIPPCNVYGATCCTKKFSYPSRVYLLVFKILIISIENVDYILIK